MRERQRRRLPSRRELLPAVLLRCPKFLGDAPEDRYFMLPHGEWEEGQKRNGSVCIATGTIESITRLYREMVRHERDARLIREVMNS